MKIGLVSDAHGNVEALERALQVLEALGAEVCYFLGDAVGYLPGIAAIECLRARRIFCLRGNHEAMLLSGNEPCDREAIYRIADARAMMSAELLDHVAQWPERHEMDAPCGRVILVHGSPADSVWGYVYPDTELQTFAVPARATVFMANTHRPFVRRNDGATFVNIGSCGLPRDCGNLGAAGLFDDRSGEARIIRFDIESETAAALSRCGPVDQTVLDVFARRSDGGCIGDVYEG